MKDNNFRLRLVVRRHGLPEVRVIFTIALENNPTIANLLEQVNEIIPLESNDWGLEDYVVELRDAEGHGFDCLHFQSVSVVLKDDEEIFIRPLVTEDRKKRRLSGRDQISLGGRHLIDGVPFGRARLRAPGDRPPIDIPPLKRRRIAYDSEEDGHDSDSDPPLLLTQYGEDDEEDEDYEDPHSVRVTAAFDNLDDPGFEADDDDEEEDDDFVEDAADDADEDIEIDGAEIDDELRDLQMENAQLEDEPFQPEEEQIPEQSPEEEAHSPDQSNSGAAMTQAALDLLALDKITALRAAFPTASVVDCEQALLGSNKDEMRAYKKLRETHEAQMSIRAMCRHGRSLGSGYSNRTLQSGESNRSLPSEESNQADDAESSGSDAKSVSSLVKHYDEYGFPSGSILAGTASTHMVEALRKSGKSVNIPVHIRFDEDTEEEAVKTVRPPAALPDDIASSSDSSRESSPWFPESEPVTNKKPSPTPNGDEVADDSSDDGFQPDSDNEEPPASDSDSSGNDSDSDDDSDSDSDSGPPEEASSKSVQRPRGGAKVSSDKSSAEDSDVSMKDNDSSDSSDDSSSDSNDSSDDSSSDSSSDDSSSSDSDSDQDGGNSGGEAGSSHKDRDSPDVEDSSSEESGNEPTPKPKSKSETGPKAARVKPLTVARLSPGGSDAAEPKIQALVDAGIQSLPGQGTTATQRRNARRRASEKAKKDAQTASIDSQMPASQPQEASTASDTFAAKKAALLKSLGLQEEPASNDSMDVDKNLDNSNVTEPSASPATVPNEIVAPTAETPKQTSASSQRTSRLDVGAGRRVLFATLGVKAPKTKAEEEALRAKLIKDVRVLPNARLESSGDGQAGDDPQDQVPEEEDPVAWREKITYRGVECCQEGVELSEPPFPFVQRWDPQQQNSWRKKGGKRKQRNQQDFYQEDDQPSAKRGRYAGYADDEGFEGESYLSAADEIGNADITLNYDDEPEQLHESPEPSQDAEEEDLPFLPNDLSTLPTLAPGEARPGMVITWKQWLLSKATNWQPQVSSMVALVVSVDHDDKSLRARLAKRDWNLDQNEKIYDDDGNRVYDKFELPGMDDDAEDGAEIGYRTLCESDMIEPRILRQPEQEVSDPLAVGEQPNPVCRISAPCTVERVGSNSTTTDQSRTIDHETLQPKEHQSQPDQMEAEVSQPKAQESQPSEVEVEASQSQEHEGQSGRMEVDAQHTGETVIPDTIIESETETRAVQPLIEEDISMTEDRRHEISVLMNEAGFRNDIDLSVAEGGPLDVSSPTRQLQEMSQETEIPTSKPPSPFPPSSPQATKTVQTVSQDPPTSSLFAESQPVILEPFNGFSDLEPVVEGQVQYPKLAPPHSDAPSAQSEKHPGSDISIELGGDLHDSVEAGPHKIDEGSEAPLSKDGKHENDDREMLSVEESDEGGFDEELDDDLESDPDLYMNDPAAYMEEGYDDDSESEASPIAPWSKRPSPKRHSPKRSEAAAALPVLGNPESSLDIAVEKVINARKARKLEAASDLDNEDVLSDFNFNRVRVKKEKLDQSNGGKMSSFAQQLANKPIEKPKAKKGTSPSKPKTEQTPLEPPPPRPRIARNKSATPSSSFRIPKGSQVISLVSSSPSPEVVEDYAEDSIDDTYQDPDLPSGPGWAKKKWQRHRGGASMPTAASAFDSVPRRMTAHRQTVGGWASAGPTRRKKTSAKF
ncbi:hypothetical protein B0H67DRAFT_553131 [Lasiosphaeris hirsuta]|uniref:DUF7357 domain-containing protein n=1 Tax=Lasiosphaeris hirsuta TaxID=260670 RepID=A0AA40ASA5_9PEZI|nr:hypothetical protein B0H67DRAFT_553131 [Lasiosphaeris hirsuta]